MSFPPSCGAGPENDVMVPTKGEEEAGDEAGLDPKNTIKNKKLCATRESVGPGSWLDRNCARVSSSSGFLPNPIGDFRVAFRLCFKVSPSAKPFT